MIIITYMFAGIPLIRIFAIIICRHANIFILSLRSSATSLTSAIGELCGLTKVVS